MDEDSNDADDFLNLQSNTINTNLMEAICHQEIVEKHLQSSCNWQKVPRNQCFSIAEKYLARIDDPDDEMNFVKDYRLNHREFLWTIGQFEKQKRLNWDIRLQFLIFLDWLSSKIHIRQLSKTYSMPRSTVHDSLKRVMSQILKLQRKIVFLPTENELKLISFAFHEKANDVRFFKNIVGAIDGSLVNLVVPEDQVEEYFDRHQNRSLNFTCICDHRKLVRFFMIGKTGSCHDMNVLKSTALYQKKLYPPKNYIILGDSAYRNTFEPISIITPYKRDDSETLLESHKSKFNRVHSRVRSTIESTYGDIKNKWRRIHQNVLESKIEMAIDTIAAAIILNNITLGDFHESNLRNFDNINTIQENRHYDCQNANEFRDKIANLFREN